MGDESQAKDSGIVRAGHDVYKRTTDDDLTATVRFSDIGETLQGAYC